MPKTATHALVWSEDMGVYELRHRSNQSAKNLRVKEAGTLSQVLDATSFAFQGKRGHLTLRKESRQHGEGYWYAYRNQGCKTIKRYVGRTADLTIGRLEEIAGTLAEELAELPQAQMKDTEEQPLRKRSNRSSLYIVPAREEANVISQGNVARKLAVPATLPPASPSPLLLAPKLLPPRLHPTLIQRPPWLLDRLERGLSGKLTLLSAPAGSGKTTLVSQWLLEHHPNLKRAVAWVSLDAADNDVLRFWHYVLTACQTLQPGLGQSALALLHQTQMAPREHPLLDDALITFLNELSQMPGRGILVLEDYHLITTPQIHESLAFMLEHLPASLHLMVVTRADPPLPLTRLRAHNELNELRAADLRFSQEETRRFLRQTIPFDLSEEVVRRLDRHIEGWATGLRLVALTLQRRTSQQESEQFLLTLSGQQKHLLEFFVTEVLDVQPLPVQIFLLQTSILDRFTGSLCDEVTGRKESERLLATMEQANLFLQPLEGSERWYRYHPLFAEAMQHEARRRLGEEAMRASYDKASRWYEQRSLLTEAISAALSARLFERAAALMEQQEAMQAEDLLRLQQEQEEVIVARLLIAQRKFDEALRIDPLSPQEQRVLHLLVAGHTNPEIAKAQVVSINTVKTQVQSIFRKLNVRSRQQAREIARKQQLL